MNLKFFNSKPKADKPEVVKPEVSFVTQAKIVSRFWMWTVITALFLFASFSTVKNAMEILYGTEVNVRFSVTYHTGLLSPVAEAKK